MLTELIELAETNAEHWDRGKGLPDEVIELAGQHGVLGLDRPVARGGAGHGPGELGAVAARLGAVCTSLRALLTVSGMVNAALDRWGTEPQRAAWLPRLTSGEVLAGFAATEAGAGTDLSAVSTSVEPSGGGYRVDGRKLWVTFGQIADLLLVLGRAPTGLVAVLVETRSGGVRVEPVEDQLGMRGCRLAHVSFDNVAVPADQLIAAPGFGLSHVVGTALDHGRFTVAWGCVGMAEACLADAAAHVSLRRQDDVALADHQVVRAMLGRAYTEVESARSLCERAAGFRESGTPETILATVVAKYAAANAAASVSQQAVQLHGAAGCAPGSRVARLFRDAKVMQIIEGAAEIATLHIGDHVVAAHARGVR